MMQNQEKLLQEFERQVENLAQKNYPHAAGLASKAFFAHILPLREKVQQITAPDLDLESGRLPFVIVITRDLVPTERAMLLVQREGQAGVTKLYPREPKDFDPIETVTIPGDMAYLLVDIDRGKANINQPPKEAMKLIVAGGRSPLTIDEGVAILTQFPDFLMKNNCFSLLASRHAGDQRVPAIWISDNKPKLAWCWDGNPHTWLGSASCIGRIGASPKAPDVD
jgi:hypothetical protein